MNYEDKEYLYWLMSVEGVGPVTVRRILEYGGGPRAAYTDNLLYLRSDIKGRIEASRPKLDEKRRELSLMLKKGIHFVAEDEDEYPIEFRSISVPPLAFFIHGKLSSQIRRRAAIVGARKASDYGKAFAEGLARELALKGVAIVSGMAEGIDGAGHKGALLEGGETIAVLGSGIDVCYPMVHYKLYDELIRNGVIISEYCSGVPGIPANFVQRNRLISALSDPVIVVEAREKSGSLITAGYALEQGKDVMAVPGRPADRLSEGTNKLIKDGAACCTCVEDVLLLMGIDVKRDRRRSETDAGSRVKSRPLDSYSEKEQKILTALSGGPLHTDEISEKTGIPAKEVMVLLSGLEIDHAVSAVVSGKYTRT